MGQNHSRRRGKDLQCEGLEAKSRSSLDCVWTFRMHKASSTLVHYKPGMVAQTYNPSIQEVREEGSPCSITVFKVIPGYIARLRPAWAPRDPLFYQSAISPHVK